MSSEPPLLVARNVSKIYPNPVAPLSRLRQALFATPVSLKGAHQVLSDINLEVRPGETLGVVGRNGAGKSTLLAILGGVIEPTSGTVSRTGRIAVLLGAGAGLHPQLTGRENAQLFCSVMGLSRREAEARLPDIEAFADIGDYFDLPARTYSSGMQARVSFSCAAHVQADLIIVDETLAVGDAEFRIRCYNLMEDRQRSGQTYLLVSHSPGIIANFCTRAVVLEKGRIAFEGAPREALNVYKDIQVQARSNKSVPFKALQPSRDAAEAMPATAVSFDDVRFEQSRGEHGTDVGTIFARLRVHCGIERPVLKVALRSDEGVAIADYDSQRHHALHEFRKGDEIMLRVTFDNRLVPGRYWAHLSVLEVVHDEEVVLLSRPDILNFTILGEARGGFVDLNITMDVACGQRPGPSSRDTSPAIG